MKLNYISYLYFLSALILLISCSDKEPGTPAFSNTELHKDSTRLEESLRLTMQHIEKNRTDSAGYQGNSLLKLSLVSENHFYAGKACSVLGYLHLIGSRDDSAYYYFNRAKEHFLQINDSVNTAKVLGNLAIIHSNQGDYSGSEIHATEALKFLGSKDSLSFKPSLYNSLAISSRKQADYTEAVYWYRKALQTDKNSMNEKICLNNIAVSHTYLGQYKQSDSILSELLKDSLVLNNRNLYANVIDNLAYSRWKQNPGADLKTEFTDALKIREEIKDEWGQIASHSHLSDYFEKRNPAASLFHARKMYGFAAKLNSPDDEREALHKLIKLESPEKSKILAVEYVNLNDSLVTARNRARDRFAKIRYDSERNRAENQLLKIETAQQELEIQKRKLFGIISASLIILVCGGSLALYRIQKVKNQKRLNEEIHTTENKIARKIHDDLANNIYRLMSFIENKTAVPGENKDYILEKLDDIYRLSRNISRENSPIETGSKYPEELMNLIASYKNEQINIILSGFREKDWENLNREIKIQFYKILQELLTNMKKHSRASLVVLSFGFEKKKLNFFYKDNGIGINENQLNAKNGIHITENRIEKINGTISFVCEPHKGLKVNISIPL